MDKIKKIFINLGQIVAILTMLAPIYIAINYEKIDDYIFWLIWFVLYDIYVYNSYEKIIKCQKKIAPPPRLAIKFTHTIRKYHRRYILL